MENFICKITSIFKEILPNKNWRKYYKALSVQLYFVNIGIKPGFIWDIGPTITTLSLQTLLIKLKKTNILHKNISLLCIEQEHCIININSLSEIPLNYFTFVDVTESLTAPSIIINTFSLLKTFLRVYSEHVHEVLDVYYVCSNEKICVPTILGIIAGYPIVYWYNLNKSSNNCLNLQSLTVYKLYIELIYKTYEVYSFSIPSSLKSQTDNHITNWHNLLLQKQLKLKLKVLTVTTTSNVVL